MSDTRTPYVCRQTLLLLIGKELPREDLLLMLHHSEMLLMHCCNFLSESLTHIFLHLKDSVHEFTSKSSRYDRGDFEPIEGRTHIVMDFVDFIVIVAQ